ncbi:conserved hypothetical protein [Gammaproteobacteria bacterium]
MKIERIHHCRICGNPQLKKVVDLGEQALSGRFPKVGTPDPLVAPLELVQCTGKDSCGLVQLAHTVPLEMMYGPSYGYLSGLNPSMKRHLEEIASEAEHLVKLEKGDVVIDIGCNDGTLLNAYTSEGLNRVGFDAPHYLKYFDGTDIKFIPEFFREYGVKAKVITSIAMFYDLPDPNLFVQSIKNTLAPDGVWILEQSYLPSMLAQNAFDTVCHEHLEYYSIPQIIWLCERNGLQVCHWDFNDVNGGSFVVYVRHQEVFDFKGFVDRVHIIKEKLTGFLLTEKGRGKTIHLYGASTKCNVLLQAFRIDYRIVSYAAERNPSKYGCWTPGTHIPIMSEDFSRACHPDYYLVGPWHFRDVFIEQMQEYLRGGGKLVFPLPYPEVVSMEGGRVVSRLL